MHRGAGALLVLTVAALAGCREAGAERRATSAAPAHATSARDAFRRPDALVAALAIPPGARVADVGAGDGYLTFRLAAAAGARGRVVATDIDPFALARLVARGPAANIEVRLAAAATPGLEARTYDLVVLAEVDQYLPDRAAYLAALAPALADGGRLVVVNRAPYEAPVREAAARAGLRVRPLSPTLDLPAQFALVLEAP